MTKNKKEKASARALALRLGITYVHALRILREEKTGNGPTAEGAS
jgi:hypothetical protein